MSRTQSQYLVMRKLYASCILVVSYGLSINLTEFIWKKMVKEAHPNKKEYQVSFTLVIGRFYSSNRSLLL